MKFKPGVLWPEAMHVSMWMARPVIDAIHLEMTGEVATCTSAMRAPTPGGSSLHPLGRALDVRVWAMGDQHSPQGVRATREFARRLRERLGPDYDVVVEGPAAEVEAYRGRSPHIHVEYDPKGWAGGAGA